MPSASSKDFFLELHWDGSGCAYCPKLLLVWGFPQSRDICNILAPTAADVARLDGGRSKCDVRASRCMAVWGHNARWLLEKGEGAWQVARMQMIVLQVSGFKQRGNTKILS